jgi:PTS system cellobiose-specific IIB component
MAEEKPIKVLIVCAMGMSSSLLETKTVEAGKNAGVEVKMHAITTPDVGMWDWQANWVDVVLVAPQVRYKRKSIAQAANPLGIIVQDIDPITFGMVDGESCSAGARGGEGSRRGDGGRGAQRALSGWPNLPGPRRLCASSWSAPGGCPPAWWRPTSGRRPRRAAWRSRYAR